MKKEKSLIVFQDKKIRRIWHDEEWYFSVSNIIAVLFLNLEQKKVENKKKEKK